MRISRAKYKAKNPDAEKVRIAAKNKRFKNANPDYSRNKSLDKYGIDMDGFRELYNLQEGKCALCDEFHPLETKVFTEILNVDHCHTTGKIRGLLCHRCNKALGLFKDNKHVLAKAICYLGE